MALNIGESSALAVVLRALGVNVHGRPDPIPLRDGQLLAALGTLTASAGKTLRLGWGPDDLRALADRLGQDAGTRYAALLPSQADVALLAAVRDRQVRTDDLGASLLDDAQPVHRIVTDQVRHLTRQGWIGISSVPTEWRLQTLTVAGRRVLEVADPSRCHYVALSGRRCWRSGPHEDWCCDRDERPSAAVPQVSADTSHKIDASR